MTRALSAAAVLLVVLSAGDRPTAHEADAAIHITSPLGRTNIPGTIRIVARVDGVPQHDPLHVQFYVDRLFLSADTDGPPYDALWTDDNPFEKRELTVEAELPTGRMIRDTMVLKPLEVEEAVDVTSVAVEATVLDQKGRFVKDLTSDRFVVTENGTPQAIDLLKQNREPALFALLVDGSQSMAIRSGAVRAAAARLIEPLAKDDQILVAPFSLSINSVTGPTTDRATVLDAIATIRHKGGTAILDALYEASSALAAEKRRKAVVLITDGYDENSKATFEAATEALKSSGVTLYVIGFGGVAGISLKGEKLLSQLAEVTGGHAWFPLDERQLISTYDAIASDVQHRYLLTYTPKNQLRDGTWRAVNVAIPGTEFRVDARKGYTAPLAPPVRASLEFTGVGTGDEAPSLTREDIVVLEDGVPQKIDVFQEAIQPVTFMLALDSSGSMKKSAAQAQSAAREFIDAMRPEDQVGMIMFASKADYIHSPTDRRDYSQQAIDAYVAEGGTALYDALYDCLAQLATVRTRRVVVVVTDGRDENAASNGPGSLRSWDDVLRKLQQTEATVYPVGIGSRVERAQLQQLADRSGGAAYFPSDVTTLSADYHKILDELRRRYVVGYQSTNRARDGKWRNVQIRAKQQEVEIRSRGGYYAPLQ
jgi:Ca-activated chloride channel family protein